MDGTESSVVYFLLIYNLREQKLESHEAFTDLDEAMRIYAQTENRYLGHGYEVVLVGSESIEAVMLTHGSYFTPQQAAVPRAGLSFSFS